MEELREKAINYAEENVINVLKEAFARVYADGYRDGYKDREEEIPVDLRDGQTEYIDLGLPSGTLWSMDYEREDGNILYLPYRKTNQYTLPTEEQCKELFDYCKWTIANNIVFCIGPNGNTISFAHSGYKEIDSNSSTYYSYISYFWIQDADETNLHKKNVEINVLNNSAWKEISKTFSGYKLPVRLIRTK